MVTFFSLSWDDILIPHVLTHLSIKDCFNLRGLSKLSRDLVDYYFTKLKRLDLGQYENFTPEAFHDLKSLKVQNCLWMTDGCLDAISYHLSNLEEVDFSSCSCLGEDSLQTFVRKFDKLRVLSLANIFSVTDQIMFAIAAHCSNLEHLNVRGCWNITDDGVRMVAEYCHKLKSLSVNDCLDVSERCLSPLRSRLLIDRPIHAHVPPPFQHLNLQV